MSELLKLVAKFKEAAEGLRKEHNQYAQGQADCYEYCASQVSVLATSPGTQGAAMRIAEALMAQNMLDVSCVVAVPVIAAALPRSEPTR